MGIKGIYAQIGRGERVALSKLAAETFERTGRPMRIAIDVSIWMFQIQSGRGGTNPAVRTFYYRLLRLLSFAIRPLFIFDGPHRPPFKRNIRIAPGQTSSLPDYLTKQLLNYFGIPYHEAPGEAEAECALLQKEGIVDAVLSEDVDTLMFGCGLCLRNWSSEGYRGIKSPTHVDLYDAQKIRSGKSGLSSQDMVLVALMSGGDYIPEGVPGCGIKVACEAAKAGFGEELCNISRKDAAGLQRWRDRLSHELHTNESKYFRVKHAALQIPANFPDPKVLKYYTEPVVSSPERLERFRRGLSWKNPINIVGLRSFVADSFGWSFKSQAIKFVRGLAPAILATELATQTTAAGSLEATPASSSKNEQVASLVKGIHGFRTHFSADGAPELRVGYIPIDVVGLDLSMEESDTEYMNHDDSSSELGDDNIPTATQTDALKSRSFVGHDPTQVEKVWILESYVNHGAPSTVKQWKESLQKPKPVRASKPGTKKTKEVMHAGALDRFVKVTKPDVYVGRGSQQPKETNILPSSSQDINSTSPESFSSLFPASSASQIQDTRNSSKSVPRKQSNATKSIKIIESPVAAKDVNPWTLSRAASSRLPSHYENEMRRGYSSTRNSAPKVVDIVDLSTDLSPQTSRKHCRPASSSSSISSLEQKASLKSNAQTATQMSSGVRSQTRLFAAKEKKAETSIGRSSKPSISHVVSSTISTREPTSARPATPERSQRFLGPSATSKKDNPIILLSSSPPLPSPSEILPSRAHSETPTNNISEPDLDLNSSHSSPIQALRHFSPSICPPASPSPSKLHTPRTNNTSIEISSSPPMPPLPTSVTRRRPRKPQSRIPPAEEKDANITASDSPRAHPITSEAQAHEEVQESNTTDQDIHVNITKPQATDLSTSRNNFKPRQQKRSVAVTLRESLDGAWKEVPSQSSSPVTPSSSLDEPAIFASSESALFQAAPNSGLTDGKGRSSRTTRNFSKRAVQKQVWEGVEILDLTGS